MAFASALFFYSLRASAPLRLCERLKGMPIKPLRLLGWVWASPWTAVGLAAGSVGLVTGGRVQQRGAAIEFYGGGVTWLLERWPGQVLVAAMTLGARIAAASGKVIDFNVVPQADLPPDGDRGCCQSWWW